MLNKDNQRKVRLDLAVTLDGLIEGKNGEIDWAIMDDEMAFEDFLNQVDTILFGRKSYDLWASYTPEAANDAENNLLALIQSKNKYVFSRTQKGTGDGVVYINDNIAEEVTKLKNAPGKDIWLYGGANIIATFINLGLVDEFRLSIHPVILGEGKPLFKAIEKRLNLKLVTAKTFSSGVVQLIYQPYPV